MKTVYKYKITAARNPDLPKGAEIISVAFQGDDLVLWARVDPDQPMTERNIDVVPTGGVASDGAVFIGTVFQSRLVFHVFDRGEVRLP